MHQKLKQIVLFNVKKKKKKLTGQCSLTSPRVGESNHLNILLNIMPLMFSYKFGG